MATDVATIFRQIDDWYERAPREYSEAQIVEWVQYNSEVACPACGEWLFVVRTRNPGDRGMSYLALCQAPDCNFQAAA